MAVIYLQLSLAGIAKIFLVVTEPQALFVGIRNRLQYIMYYIMSQQQYH
jgi:hypothetical protein